MIYLDYAATAPMREEAIEAMLGCLGAGASFANPSSDHLPGQAAARLVEEARERFAALIGAQPAEIIWTSGATEANNLALLGGAAFHQDRGRRIALARTEHKSVLDPCRQLAGQGYKLDWLDTDGEGRIAAESVEAALKDDSLLLSAMLVNNETGVVQNIPEMAGLCAERGALLHVDASQALGKLPLDCQRWEVSMMSFSAHKFGGPKGVGALYLRSKPPVRVRPLVYGGGQERGLRSGTLAVHQIIGMVRAAELAEAARQDEFQRLAGLRQGLWKSLREALPRIRLNGSEGAQSPHVLNVSFEGVDGEALRADLTGLAVSSGSACTSEQAESSYVLRAMGRSDALADASLRFSFGWQTTEEEIAEAARQVIATVRRLRALAPDWDEAA